MQVTCHEHRRVGGAAQLGQLLQHVIAEVLLWQAEQPDGPNLNLAAQQPPSLGCATIRTSSTTG